MDRVGMSQYGALAQAMAGRSAGQILASYYTGTTYDQVPDTQTILVNIVSGATTTVSGRSTGTNGGTLTVAAGGRTLTAPAGQSVTLRRAGVTTVRLLGPSSRISTAVAQDLAGHGLRVMRFAGAGHGDACAELAEYFRNSYTGTRVVLARTSSDRTSDAALAAGYRAPVLVVTTAPGASVTTLVQRRPQWPTVVACGPSARVGSTTLTRVRDA